MKAMGQSRNKARNFLLKVHIYLGLACFWYVVVLGISSLHFNHHFPFMEEKGAKKEWSTKIALGNTFTDDRILSETLRDSLGLIGWPLPWETYHDSTGLFHFDMEQPSKSYDIDYSFNTHIAKVQETPKGFWRTFNSLHGSGSVPNSSWMFTWGWYTRFVTLSMFFSVLLGMYLWADNKPPKGQMALFAISVLGMGLWMLMLYLNG